MMEQTFCYALDDGTQDEAVLAARCAAAERLHFGVNAQARDVKVLSAARMRETDLEAARRMNGKCVVLCRGRQTPEGMCAYVEPTFVPLDGVWPDCPETAPETDVPCDKTDHSIEIHPYYIRFSGDSGGWLDIVTKARVGDGVFTMPVSVKAAHNWAEHAKRYDPEVFLAGILDA